MRLTQTKGSSPSSSPKTPAAMPCAQISLLCKKITLLLACVAGNAVVATETSTHSNSCDLARAFCSMEKLN